VAWNHEHIEVIGASGMGAALVSTTITEGLRRRVSSAKLMSGAGL